MRRSASSGASASIAPGQMSMASGVPTMRVSSGTPAPGCSALDRHLAGSLQVGVVVDLDPLDVADRRRADSAAAVRELLEAVFVVVLGVAAPRRLERFGQRLGCLGLDQREPDVLALRRPGIE